MIPPRNILVPTDFSEPAEAALDYAVALAGKLDARVHLLDVVDLQGFHFSDLGVSLTPEMIDTIIAGNQAALERLAQTRRGDRPDRRGNAANRRSTRCDRPAGLPDERRSDRDGYARATWLQAMDARERRGDHGSHRPCPVLTVHPPM